MITLHPLLVSTDFGTCSYQCFLFNCTPVSLRMLKCSWAHTLSCLFVYCSFVSIGHADIIWSIVSSNCRQSLHLLSVSVLIIIIIIIKPFRKTVEINSVSPCIRASPNGWVFLKFRIWNFCLELSTHWYFGQNWTEVRHWTWIRARIYDISPLSFFKIETVCFLWDIVLAEAEEAVEPWVSSIFDCNSECRSWRIDFKSSLFQYFEDYWSHIYIKM